jgi:hypothetical protein
MLGPAGLEILSKTRELIPPEIPVIADAKRGDIENTARAYAKALFEYYRFDAATVNPLMGFDSVAPFCEYPEKCAFLLVRTSNPGARDFQELNCAGQAPLSAHRRKSPPMEHSTERGRGRWSYSSSRAFTRPSNRRRRDTHLSAGRGRARGRS